MQTTEETEREIMGHHVGSFCDYSVDDRGPNSFVLQLPRVCPPCELLHISLLPCHDCHQENLSLRGNVVSLPFM